MGNTPQVMEFTKEGITYHSDQAIPPHRSRFTKGTKDFHNGWKQQGTFHGGHFRSGTITRPDGWKIKGEVTPYSFSLPLHEGTIRGYSMVFSPGVIVKGTICDPDGCSFPLYVTPLAHIRVLETECLVGTMGEYSGLFTADREHGCVQPLWVWDQNQKLVLKPELPYLFFYDLGFEKVWKKDHIRYRCRDSSLYSRIPEDHYRLLFRIIRTYKSRYQ